MRRPVLLLAAALVATAALVLAGVAIFGGDDGGPQRSSAAPRPTASFTTTPLTAYDVIGARITRTSFCDRIDPRQVTAALGAPASTQRSWADGDRTQLGSGLTDVAHEFGCAYTGADGAQAQAWVFAPPVRTGTAARLARQTDGVGTCAASTATPTATLGAPSGLLSCQSPQTRSATYRGLLGDAWLSCEVDLPAATPAAEVTDRAGRWCVGVLRAAAVR